MSGLIAPLSEMEEEQLAITKHRLDRPITAGQEQRDEERSHALRLLYATADAEQTITLPILATAGDVREVVQYLKKKPTGVSVVEAMDDVKRRVFEPRKIAAYEFWGIVNRLGGDRLQLSPLGWEFAHKLEPETEAYRAVLANATPYRDALEWMHRENHDLVTHTEVAAYWQKLFPASIGQNQKTIESSVVCFFHICQAAEIGTMTIGKRGQPARLRVEREELIKFIEGRTHKMISPGAGLAPEKEDRPIVAMSSSVAKAPATTTSENLRLFISCRTESQLIDQLHDALELINIESRTVVGSEFDALPLSEEIFQSMRQCDAALVVVTSDDCHDDGMGTYILNQHVLILINTAFVLYDRRVMLIWNCQMPLPGNLSSLPHFTFEGDELTWDVGMRLMQVTKEFQERARHTVR